MRPHDMLITVAIALAGGAILNAVAQRLRVPVIVVGNINLGGAIGPILALQVRENLGLPCEALQRYSAVQERLPNRPSVLSRLVFVERSLQAPLTIPSGTWAVRNR